MGSHTFNAVAVSRVIHEMILSSVLQYSHLVLRGCRQVVEIEQDVSSGDFHLVQQSSSFSIRIGRPDTTRPLGRTQADSIPLGLGQADSQIADALTGHDKF